MSRPSASVPSRNSGRPFAVQAGGTSSASRYCIVGSCGAISGAKIAVSTISAEDDEADHRAAVAEEIVPVLAPGRDRRRPERLLLGGP